MTKKIIEDVRELQNWAQINANKHGWVDKWNIHGSTPQHVLDHLRVPARVLSIGDSLALLHSEVSEAFEEYEKDLSSDEFAFELADILIRIFHMTGDLGFEHLDAQLCFRLQTTNLPLNRLQNLAYIILNCENEELHNKSLEYVMCQINVKISKALEAFRDNSQEKFCNWMVETLVWTLYLAERTGYNATDAINIKMLKNEQRAIMHGRANL